MKKRKIILGLLLLFTMMFSSALTAYADEEVPVENETIEKGYIEPDFSIPPSGELSAYCGANGNVDFYLHVAEENCNQITRICFLDKNTGDEYFFKFNPENYNDDSLWVQRINIPQGDYFVSCRVSGDDYGRYSCSLFPEGRMMVGKMLESVVCLVGPQEWIDSTYTEMEKAEDVKVTPTPKPTLIPKLTWSPLDEIEYIITNQQSVDEASVEKNYTPLYIVLGVVVIGVVLMFAMKKKK